MVILQHPLRFVVLVIKQALKAKTQRKHVPGSVDVGRQSALRKPDGAHAVVNPAGAEPPLSDLEASPFTEYNIGERNLDVPIAVGQKCV